MTRFRVNGDGFCVYLSVLCLVVRVCLSVRVCLNDTVNDGFVWLTRVRGRGAGVTVSVVVVVVSVCPWSIFVQLIDFPRNSWNLTNFREIHDFLVKFREIHDFLEKFSVLLARRCTTGTTIVRTVPVCHHYPGTRTPPGGSAVLHHGYMQLSHGVLLVHQASFGFKEK